MTGSILSPVASRAAFMGPGSSGSEIARFSVLFIEIVEAFSFPDQSQKIDPSMTNLLERS